jgi:AAA family ATP:ADP antiporter
MPVLSVLCFVWVAADPSLLVIAIVDVIRRASGFTFSKPSTDMLYSVVTPEEKYKTKNFIDTTVYRFGDVIGIFLIRSMLTLGYSAVSLIMVPFAIAWIWVATWLGKDYRRRARELRKKGLT